MCEWNNVSTQDDIDDLLDRYGGFHDSCLVELNYKTGEFVDDKGGMHFGFPEHKELRMIFHSQWEDKPLELCFTGVRKYCVAGWQRYYGNELLDCYLKIHTDLMTGRDDVLIVWADNMGFNPKTTGRDILAEPMDTYVIASELKWRFLKENKNCCSDIEDFSHQNIIIE